MALAEPGGRAAAFCFTDAAASTPGLARARSRARRGRESARYGSLVL